ncbi:MAG: hypothetical protein ACK481_10750 [Candidatus Melainabacteria bacterium]|jgi:hypothetical protein
MKKIFAILGFMLLASSSMNVASVDACPKRFRTIKFVGRTVKNTVGFVGEKIASGCKSLSTKIRDEV